MSEHLKRGWLLALCVLSGCTECDRTPKYAPASEIAEMVAPEVCVKFHEEPTIEEKYWLRVRGFTCYASDL